MSTPTFAETLARLRAARGVSQTILAQYAGRDHSFMSRLEAGKRLPSRETVMILADQLNLSDYDRACLLRSAGFWPDDPGMALQIALEERYPNGMYMTLGTISTAVNWRKP